MYVPLLAQLVDCQAMFWASIILHNRRKVTPFGQVPLEVLIQMLALVLGLRLRATRALPSDSETVDIDRRDGSFDS